MLYEVITNTDAQFSDALAALEESGVDSLIIDLRDNTGGHLTAVSYNFV